MKPEKSKVSMNIHGLRCTSCGDRIVLPVVDKKDKTTDAFVLRAKRELAGSEVEPSFHLFLESHRTKPCAVEAVTFLAVGGQSALNE